ncbi:hypothetical protein BaRGS_00007847 [Batillaria attramentaria]|uniref:Uncharacterized protein n=1 Tax=Batillaria attramentaria TaxID=370345 RepID=A0ABD0LPH3_9CAEN
MPKLYASRKQVNLALSGLHPRKVGFLFLLPKVTRNRVASSCTCPWRKYSISNWFQPPIYTKPSANNQKAKAALLQNNSALPSLFLYSARNISSAFVIRSCPLL